MCIFKSLRKTNGLTYMIIDYIVPIYKTMKGCIYVTLFNLLLFVCSFSLFTSSILAGVASPVQATC